MFHNVFEQYKDKEYCRSVWQLVAKVDSAF